jgi:hypothetical protein
MEQPRSIKLFSLCFWFGTLIDVAAMFLFWEQTFTEEMELEMELASNVSPFGFEGSLNAVLLVLVAAIYGLTILLWYFITERRSKFAKWLIVAMNCLLIAFNISELPTFRLDEQLIYGTTTLLAGAAIAFLFTPEARDWFNRKQSIPTDVFE